MFCVKKNAVKVVLPAGPALVALLVALLAVTSRYAVTHAQEAGESEVSMDALAMGDTLRERMDEARGSSPSLIQQEDEPVRIVQAAQAEQTEPSESTESTNGEPAQAAAVPEAEYRKKDDDERKNLFGLAGISGAVTTQLFNNALKGAANTLALALLSGGDGGQRQFNTPAFVAQMQRDQVIARAQAMGADATQLAEEVKAFDGENEPPEGFVIEDNQLQKGGLVTSDEICRTVWQTDCPETHQVLKLTTDNICECVGSVRMELVFRDMQMSMFDRNTFIEAFSQVVGIDRDSMELVTVRPGSVITDIAIFADVSGPQLRARSAEGGQDGFGHGFSNETMSNLEVLLSSHYLEGYGDFKYEISMPKEMCGQFPVTKKRTRSLLERNRCRPGSTSEGCHMVWGREVSHGYRNKPNNVFLKGFKSAPDATEVLYQSIRDAVSNDSIILSIIETDSAVNASLEKMNEVLSSGVGRHVELPLGPEISLLLESGMANYSSTENCTETCTKCTSIPDIKQPFIQWQFVK